MLVECEVDFGRDDDAVANERCVARINGKEVDARAIRDLKLTNANGEKVALPLSDGGRDVVVYLR